MSQTHGSLVSSSSRPLLLKMRADLICERQTYEGRDYWMVKDPIALKYFRFEEEEFGLLKMLDGKTSADEIQYKFHQRFAPQKLSLAELFQLVGTLYRSSLLISESSNQGRELLRREQEARRRQRRGQWLNILAFQFRGFDPDRLLTILNRWFGGFFSVPMLVVNVLLGLAAAGLLAAHWTEVQNRLPGFHEFFNAGNWFWLAATLTLVKVLHEFGHGISCKRFGGQCHELGVMLLVMTPCLYVNVSDAWTIPDKWKRMAIAAAGMYVELFLASIAAFVWWFTHPGLINQLALNAIFVCSVSTLLFNANPLMKYDGYYILSDWLEIPNLRQKSATLLQRAVSQIGLGMEVLHDPFLPQRRRWLFASYSMASAIYRCFVTVSIFFFFYKVLEPYGFKVIGQILALLMIVGIALPPLVQVVRLFSIPGRLGQVKTSRALLTAALLSGLVLGALAIPLPHHVRCGLYVQPAHSATMYVKAPGRVRTLLAQPNQWVNAGDPVMELENSDLQMDLADLSGQNEVARKALQFAVRISHEDAKFAGDVETAEARLASVTTLASQRQRDLENLIIRAPISGVLVAADYVAPADDDDGNLGRWYGRVLEPRNIGSFVHEGTNVGQIVPDPTKLEAVLAIDQGDIEFIGKGQAVEMWIRECPTRTFRSQLSEVSCAQMKAVPRCLSQKFGGDLNTTTAADKSERPASTTYRVAVPLDDAQGTLLVGSSGKAKVRVGYRTIGQWLWRMICQTVRFEL